MPETRRQPATDRGAVVVTGVSSGLGRATALRLLRAGFHVIGTVRNARDGEYLQQQAGQVLVMDVAGDDQVEQAIGSLDALLADGGGTGECHRGKPGLGTGGSGLGERRVGAEAPSARRNSQLVGLVCNAGIAVGGPLELVPIDRLRRQMEVNVVGLVHVIQRLLPRLREARGRIILMGSVSGRIAGPMVGPYAASKYAVEAIGDTLRREVEPLGVGVTILEPGPIQSEIWQKAQARVADALRDVPADSPYRARLEDMEEELAKIERRALPAEVVARAVHRTLTCRRPPTRMLIMRHGWLLRLMLATLPDRWLDRILR